MLRMSNSNSTITFSIPFILAFFLSCGSQDYCSSERLTFERNVDRIFNKIPIMESNWQRNNCTWVNPEFVYFVLNGEAFHFSKRLVFEKEKLSYELDEYRSGKNINVQISPDSSIWVPEMVVTKYSYIDTLQWICFTNAGGNNINNRISLEEADSIIKSWGIKRLNYEFNPPNN